jgi:hypothetical protein
MKPKLVLWLALVLGGGLFGCATQNRLHPANWQPPLPGYNDVQNESNSVPSAVDNSEKGKSFTNP